MNFKQWFELNQQMVKANGPNPIQYDINPVKKSLKEPPPLGKLTPFYPSSERKWAQK